MRYGTKITTSILRKHKTIMWFRDLIDFVKDITKVLENKL